MVDIAVKSGAAWVCHAQGRHLADVTLLAHNSDEDIKEELHHSDGDGSNRSKEDFNMFLGPVLFMRPLRMLEGNLYEMTDQ